ncbi:MAG TPA: tRNA lysidine(34) synthetase TilS [Bryobacteraceae bacterium]|nr:tRNA lysidine(34) synthetase TilS [Bryobacteraceae bacterium]
MRLTMKELNSPVLDRVTGIISRYNMIRRGARLGLAVSGGADSVCLLHLLRELAPTWAATLSVLHLNHLLRGEQSDSDAEFVGKMASELGLPFHQRRVDVAAVADNLEQAGRQARLEFFREMLASDLDRVATGHTESDQAETVLFRFLRGAGTAGLSGILPVTGEGLIRPLLNCSRAEIEDFLRERSIPWREDHTNQDLRYARNRIRIQLIPQLEAEHNPAVIQTLAHMAVLANDEESYWVGEMDRLAPRLLIQKGPALLLRVKELTDLPIAVRRRLVRRALQMVKGDLRSLSFPHVERVLAMAGDPAGHGRAILPGLDIFRSFEWLRIAPPHTVSRQERDYCVPLAVPGSQVIPHGGSRIQLEIFEIPAASGAAPQDWGYNTVDGDRLASPLELRNWRPGDQYARPGGTTEKIKFLFQQERIPLWDRQGWPIITSGDRIVWARQFGPAADYLPTSSSRRILRITEVENNDEH